MPWRQGYRKVVHVVEKGDSLWLIGNRYGVSLSSLRRWNRTNGTARIRPGQKIVVWVKDPAAEPPPGMAEIQPAGVPAQEIWYTVQPGDSLWEIARRFGVTVSDLSRWNQIDTHRPIRPGLRLRIYQDVKLNADMHARYPESLPD